MCDGNQGCTKKDNSGKMVRQCETVGSTPQDWVDSWPRPDEQDERREGGLEDIDLADDGLRPVEAAHGNGQGSWESGSDAVHTSSGGASRERVNRQDDAAGSKCSEEGIHRIDAGSHFTDWDPGCEIPHQDKERIAGR